MSTSTAESILLSMLFMLDLPPRACAAAKAGCQRAGTNAAFEICLDGQALVVDV